MSPGQLIAQVNTTGFAATPLDPGTARELGEPLYRAFDAVTLHPNRSRYYNEIAFYWPEDWAEVEEGLSSFHDPKTIEHIHTRATAEKTLSNAIGAALTLKVMSFAESIRHGFTNNELRLSRVMIRQMNENDSTQHAGATLHEDRGYPDREYQHLLSVIVTTWGQPTEAPRYNPRVGEILVFNAYDRRRQLGLPDSLAFTHRGPATGPKMFFFFEFLGPRAIPREKSRSSGKSCLPPSTAT